MPVVDQLIQTVGGVAINVGLALLILIGGWLIALLIAAGVRKLLERTSLDNQLASRVGSKPGFNVEDVIGKIVFWIVMLFVLVTVFQFLDLPQVTEPLNTLLDGLFAFVPNLLGAAALAFVAWIIATVLRLIISKILGATKLDDTLSSQVGLAEEGRPPMSETLATIVYWFIWLLFLPMILGALQLQGLLFPIQDMLSTLLVYLPNVVGSVVILLVGWFIARIIRQIVTSFLAAVGTDNLGNRVGIQETATGGQALSAVIGTVVYVLVLIPVIIAALQALQIEAISAPATNMLNTLLNAIPAIFGAMLILGITYFVARLVSGLVTTLLTSVGFNRVLALIGLGGEAQEGQWTPSELVGYLVLVGLMLFATIEATELLGFGIVADLVARFLTFFFQVILALIIFGLGMFAANLAHRVVLSTAGRNANLLAQAARVVIIIFAAAIALFEVGVAEDIVNLAFGISLAAVAVAVALAFGLGSREIAGREVETLLKRFRSDGS